MVYNNEIAYIKINFDRKSFLIVKKTWLKYNIIGTKFPLKGFKY